MKINIVIPPQHRQVFSGGALCLLNYAKGLSERGHDVTVVSSQLSSSPEWFPQPWGFRFLSPSISELGCRPVRALARAGVELARSLLSGRVELSGPTKRHLQESLDGMSNLAGQRGGFGAAIGAAVDNLARLLPPADVTIASSFETAYPVAIAGQGRRFYFAQHYEPLFWKECAGAELARTQAELSYRLGLQVIANSQWLSEQLQARVGLSEVPVCFNAIDHGIFAGQAKPRTDAAVLRVLSYGGRNAEWKGFREMCEGVRRARLRHPGIHIEWSVYGSALLPPDNPVTPYRALGFLDQRQLAETYKANDVLLSASWYESFPLFPLEGMASGIAVICTQPGTESYADHGVTAEIVAPECPEQIAAALERLALDESYRFALADRGRQRSLQFQWSKSVERLEGLLS